MGIFKKIKDFVVEVVVTVKNDVINFLKGMWNHIESVAVLSLASLGLSNLLGVLPFWVALPMWVEGPLIFPVISVLTIWGLMKIAERRGKRRLATVSA